MSFIESGRSGPFWAIQPEPDPQISMSQLSPTQLTPKSLQIGLIWLTVWDTNKFGAYPIYMCVYTHVHARTHTQFKATSPHKIDPNPMQMPAEVKISIRSLIERGTSLAVTEETIEKVPGGFQ